MTSGKVKRKNKINARIDYSNHKKILKMSLPVKVKNLKSTDSLVVNVKHADFISFNYNKYE